MSKLKSILAGVGLFLLRIVLIALGTAAFVFALAAITALLKAISELIVLIFGWIVTAIDFVHAIVRGAIDAVPQWQYYLVWVIAAATIWTVAERLFKRYKK